MQTKRASLQCQVKGVFSPLHPVVSGSWGITSAHRRLTLVTVLFSAAAVVSSLSALDARRMQHHPSHEQPGLVLSPSEAWWTAH